MQSSVVMSSCSADFQCIVSSLDYLSHEAKAMGMGVASDIIRSAIIKIKVTGCDTTASFEGLACNDDLVVLAMKFLDAYVQTDVGSQNKIIDTLKTINKNAVRSV